MSREAAAPRVEGPSAYALHKDALSRTILRASPHTAKIHGRAFSQCVPLIMHRSDEANLGRHASVLWGASQDLPAPLNTQGTVSSYLPLFYEICNPQCAQCHVPLVDGVTARLVCHKRQLRHKHGAKFVYPTRTALECTLCLNKRVLSKPRTARCFSSVRQRRKQRDAILAGQVANSMESSFKTNPKSKLKTSEACFVETQTENVQKPSTQVLETPELKNKKTKAQGPYVQKPSTSISSKNSSQPSVLTAFSTKRNDDVKAGLRALFQQKKQKDEAQATKSKSGGLADFLQQL